jgi:hypothetical protein
VITATVGWAQTHGYRGRIDVLVNDIRDVHHQSTTPMKLAQPLRRHVE